MAASSHKKRRIDEWNGGLALPDAKRTNSVKLVHDSDLMALLEMIDNMDAINSDPEETNTAIQLEDELRLNGVMKSLEQEVGLKGQAEAVESVDEKGGSIKQITDWNPEATSASDTGDMHSEENLTYNYDDIIRAEQGFFVDHTALELGIIMNVLDGDSMANMYSDAVYGYAETPAVFYGSLWEDDIWQFNEPPVIQNNDIESRQKEDFGISEIDCHHISDDIKPI